MWTPNQKEDSWDRRFLNWEAVSLIRTHSGSQSKRGRGQTKSPKQWTHQKQQIYLLKVTKAIWQEASSEAELERTRWRDAGETLLRRRGDTHSWMNQKTEVKTLRRDKRVYKVKQESSKKEPKKNTSVFKEERRGIRRRRTEEVGVIVFSDGNCNCKFVRFCLVFVWCKY